MRHRKDRAADPYQLGNSQLVFLYLIVTPTGLFYAGDGPAYASAPGQIDPAKSRFLTGHFTRADGVEQVALVYQLPNSKIKVQIFDPAPQANPPVGGFAEMWTSPDGYFDIAHASGPPRTSTATA